MLLTGDACNTVVYLFDEDASSVEEYLEFMKLLKQQADGRYDQILLCHGIDPNRHPEHGPIQPIGIIEGAIWLCNAILNGKDDHVPTKAMDRIGYSAKGGNAV